MRHAAIALIVLGGSAFTANADIVASWAFNTGQSSGTVVSLPMAATSGVGSLTSNFEPDGVVLFGGTTVNDLDGNGSGLAIAFRNGTGGANNGRYAEFSFDTTSYEDIVLSFAGQRTSTGFTSIDVQVFNGSGFVSAGTISGLVATSSARTLDLSSFDALENTANARVRFVFSGGATTSTAGNNRLDNVYFSGSLVPAPGATALVGLAGLVAARRRR